MKKSESFEIKFKEENLKKILKKENIIKDLDNLKIKQIWKNIFLGERKGNITWYLKENSELIFVIQPIREAFFFNQGAYLAWYREIKDNNWVYKMYKMEDIIESTGNPKPNAKELDKYSMEYFQVWKDIIFYIDKLWIETFKKKTDKWKYFWMDLENLTALTKSGSLKIKDLEIYLKNKQVDQKTFDKVLKILQSQLLSQVWDIRFDRIKEEITRKELEDYFIKWYISVELYDKALKKLTDVELQRKSKNSQKTVIQKETKRDLKKVK